MTQEPKTEHHSGEAGKIKVSPQVAQLVAKGVPRERQLEAARGAVPLSPKDQLTALLFLCHSTDAEIRTAAIGTGRRLTASQLEEVIQTADCHPQLLTLLAQLRAADAVVVKALLAHPALPLPALHHLAARSSGAALEPLLQSAARFSGDPAFSVALLANPHLDPSQRDRLNQTAENHAQLHEEEVPEDAEVSGAVDEPEEESEPEEEINQSKYQQALEMAVAEKIKMALTGDKEWRSIFIKDPNKLVHGAALKNPRITEGEVLALAKNKTSSDEMIRIILLNRDWLKNYSIKAALVTHPKTPTPTALRFLNVLGEKELKNLARSKGVSQIIVNAARRALIEKQKKR